ncbi:MAG: DUF2851 family protein [Chitinophagaceae bacterium]|nr:DUF2851 family protein [Chitinophagaceae bacterium]MCW5904648.1 DUF2851 family protein [Chitinophagaceae bacterium]
MTEKLLHFIWQFQYFNKTALTTTNGEQLTIIKTGTLNTNQGPDFLHASVKINNVTLVGNIEIHINASDWLKHQHQKDKNYDNVILHIVWKNDKPLFVNNQLLPTLELQNLVAKILLDRYNNLMQTKDTIPCQKFLPALSEIAWLPWKERLAAERLESKSLRILFLLQESNHHWEEVFWWLIAANFGIKINVSCFEEMAKTITVKILAKHKNNIHQLEALLLGQANLLNNTFTDDYAKNLQKEYQFLQHKYKLQTVTENVQFLRMRPANFPTIRLAQLAMLIQNSSHLFSIIKEVKTVKEVREMLSVTASEYWNNHYILAEETSTHPKQLGNQMIDNIIINTIVPILFAYGLYNKDEVYKDKAIQWLQQTPAEKNTVISKWVNVAIKSKSAFDTQALLQLDKVYCKQLRCLECAIGNKVLKIV